MGSNIYLPCKPCCSPHLEVASQLDTDSCINAICRFICCQGSIKSIRSDQGTNFIGAQKELEGSVKQLDNDKIPKTLLKRGTEWTFNPLSGAHHGGVWEKLIRPVKKILYSVLEEQTLDDEGLHTTLCEVEAIMNDRPITTGTSDPNDRKPLTPNHLLLLKSNPVMPPDSLKKRTSTAVMRALHRSVVVKKELSH